MEVESVILLGLKKWASLSLLGTSVWGGMGGPWEGIYWLFSVFVSVFFFFSHFPLYFVWLRSCMSGVGEVSLQIYLFIYSVL